VQIQNAPRRNHATEMHLDAPPQRVFPLLCPVREYDWIDRWSCDIVYAETGVAELGGIFTTRSPEAGEEVWTISRYEPPHAIEFVRVAAQVWVATLAFALEPEGTGGTVARTRRTYTALSGVGALEMERITPEVQDSWARDLERMLNHYLTTGEMLRREPARATS
jgi:uncharacterized protein YndB with AHSA1/START domain